MTRIKDIELYDKLCTVVHRGKAYELCKAQERIEFLEDQIVSMWHGDGYVELHEALGFTEEEYGRWVVNSEAAISRT